MPIPGKRVQWTCSSFSYFWGKKAAFVNGCVSDNKNQNDNVCLVIPVNRFIIAENGRGLFVSEIGYTITLYPDKKYGSFRYKYYKPEEELPPCDIDRIKLFDGLLSDAKVLNSLLPS